MHQQKQINHVNAGYIVKWSEEKYQQMNCQLTEYWAQDIWTPRETPLRNKDKDKQKKSVGACLRFGSCPNFTITVLIGELIKTSCLS